MNRFIVLVAAFCSVVSGLDWRIIGGSTAEDGQFPYQISLRDEGSHTCGGSIINDEWILTAAHCVIVPPASALNVVTGTNNLESSGDSYDVERVVYHSGFDLDHLHDDIGLIKIKGKIRFNDKVQPIPLNTKYIGAGANLVVSGWGRDSFPGDIATNLQFINLVSITSDDCNNRHQSTGIGVDETQICTFTQSGQGVCHGDSGGPLTYQGTVAGIVSWVRPCAIGYPDVFTRVSSYLQWIEENMQ